MNDRTAAVADGCLSITDATEFSGLSRSALYVLMRDRQLVYVQRGRKRLVPRKALCELLAAGLTAGPTPTTPTEDTDAPAR